jgi:Na+/H+-dicarboxylate symporter
VVTIALIICIPITAIVVGFLVLKSVQVGLRWQIQTAQKQEPELKSPIQPIVEAVQENKAEAFNKQREQFLKEYSPFQ